MFVLLTGLYQRSVLINLDTVTHISPTDNGCKVHTLNGTVDVTDSFDRLVDIVTSKR